MVKGPEGLMTAEYPNHNLSLNLHLYGHASIFD